MNIHDCSRCTPDYVASTDNLNLAVLEAEEYTLNFRVTFKENETGIGAFELLVYSFLEVLNDGVSSQAL